MVGGEQANNKALKKKRQEKRLQAEKRMEHLAGTIFYSSTNLPDILWVMIEVVVCMNEQLNYIRQKTDF